MGSWIDLKAGDCHAFKAYRSAPDGKARGGIVLLQEIFGVNEHIRDLVDTFASQGYDTVAPALFDRIKVGTELGYTERDVARGRELQAELPFDMVMLDVAAARNYVAESGKVSAIGYCWGGTLAWLAATRLDVSCVVGYYGSMTVDFLNEEPRCPVTLMLGETDTTFGPEKIEAIGARHPDVVMFTYPGGHGFACDHRDSWDEASARLAQERTLDVLLRYLG